MHPAILNKSDSIATCFSSWMGKVKYFLGFSPNLNLKTKGWAKAPQ